MIFVVNRLKFHVHVYNSLNLPICAPVKWRIFRFVKKLRSIFTSFGVKLSIISYDFLITKCTDYWATFIFHRTSTFLILSSMRVGWSRRFTDRTNVGILYSWKRSWKRSNFNWLWTVFVKQSVAVQTFQVAFMIL